jgi:hypothetical protein
LLILPNELWDVKDHHNQPDNDLNRDYARLKSRDDERQSVEVYPMRQGLVLVAISLLMTAQAVQAQDVAAPATDTSAVVEELVIEGRPMGPALWRVKRGDAVVVVLGGLVPLPHQLKWTSPRLERALGTADLILVPPQGRPQLTDLPGMTLRVARLRQGLGQRLEPNLSPALRARFVQARERLAMGPGRYDHWKPAIAGFMLLADFREHEGLSTGKPATTVQRMAKAQRGRRLKIQPMADIHLGAMVKSAANLTPAQHEACLTAALNDIEAETARARMAAQAWAMGDLVTVRANASADLLDRCLLQLPSLTSLLEQDTAQSVRSLNQALTHPGTTVAIIDLRLLLRADGVLDRLKAQGAEISVPKD